MADLRAGVSAVVLELIPDATMDRRDNSFVMNAFTSDTSLPRTMTPIPRFAYFELEADDVQPLSQ